MKNLLAFLLIGIFGMFNAQGYLELNKVLHRLEQENKINHETELHYDLEGKKFLFLKDFPEKTERKILETKEGKSMLIELEDHKNSQQTTSKIYTGDLIRKKHVVSIRLDLLEGNKLNIPIAYLYHLTYQKGIWYLIDANTGERWIDIEGLQKSKELLKQDTKKQKRKNKKRE
ncbi:MAG: hypothetical protein Q4A00_00265 [Flavobacteriaceae bacterium]|nr:hypothetical protein [Flavobacteriaceae bacterium]